MKATAKAHPIQGLVKYHGMRDEELRLPYHDSISVCTAPSHSKTTAEFDPDRDEDVYVIDGEPVEGRGAERIDAVVDHVRNLAEIDHGVRFESANNFPTNIGFGSSSSAARAVTGAFSHLRTGMNDKDCRSERIETDLEDDLRIVAGMVPSYKETEAAHREAAESHLFEARLAHIHGQIAEMRDALYDADFDRAFELAEHDSLSLAATTMTGPAGWVYWQPRTIEIFNTVRELREDGVPVYFSVDTGASVYVNTLDDHVDRVEEAIADCGVETRVWDVGGPAQVLDDDQALF